jgi:hypothetical protein
MSNKFLRILKHRWLDDRDTARALGPDALQRLEARVHASEGAHSGEIRLCVEAGLPLSYLWKGLSARDRAITLFGKLRVWDTEANNGVRSTCCWPSTPSKSSPTVAWPVTYPRRNGRLSWPACATPSAPVAMKMA